MNSNESGTEECEHFLSFDGVTKSVIDSLVLTFATWTERLTEKLVMINRQA